MSVYLEISWSFYLTPAILEMKGAMVEKFYLLHINNVVVWSQRITDGSINKCLDVSLNRWRTQMVV